MSYSLCTQTGYDTQVILCPTGVIDDTRIVRDLRGMANRLKYYREAAGFTQEALARAVGSGRSMMAKLESGERPLSQDWLDRLSRVLDCAPADILGDDVPVVGKIGAGGSIIFEDVGIGDVVKRPPDAAGKLVALEVSGHSMLPKFDEGDLVYISRERDGVDPQDIGSICACRLLSGETYLKQIARSSKAGLFVLRSMNAADMEDVELEWATPVRAITPKAARRFI